MKQNIKLHWSLGPIWFHRGWSLGLCCLCHLSLGISSHLAQADPHPGSITLTTRGKTAYTRRDIILIPWNIILKVIWLVHWLFARSWDRAEFGAHERNWNGFVLIGSVDWRGFFWCYVYGLEKKNAGLHLLSKRATNVGWQKVWCPFSHVMQTHRFRRQSYMNSDVICNSRIINFRQIKFDWIVSCRIHHWWSLTAH